ncbi:phospholipase D-like domain-containing protein [Lyngbya confervoides]|uniref:Phospholipase D-like domain-containing protein n=1 Tax=Lyngbya confervoides BDU141951 TaxID=1574623 RepID=A0ABD4SZ89_9CYAN|nr:phospholipase D-like domain-containing protein [Lyngbya confervoides]MCM1981637.1 phospholipase D-like domain-containing protein [Lyngbya confervoides BDU141951]
MQDLDLNSVWIDNDGNYPDVTQRDNSIVNPNRSIQVYFRNLELYLISHIARADAIFGCIAWLTSGSILDALARKSVVSIVVQKEDFLRPDLGGGKDWKNWLRKKYKSLQCNIDRYSFDNIISNLSVCSDPTLDPIRCVGNYNRDKAPAFPRMHNKFMIFAKLSTLSDVDQTQLGSTRVNPYAVWTGSFNLTKNAGKSLENALFITDLEVVQAYFSEFSQIVAISEPLDWEVDWAEPEWRVGT